MGKVWAYVILAGVLVSGVTAIYQLGARNEALNLQVAQGDADRKQLKKDAEKVKTIKANALVLRKRLKRAEQVFKQTKDPTGCFRQPVPKPASDELCNVYKDISKSQGCPPI